MAYRNTSLALFNDSTTVGVASLAVGRILVDQTTGNLYRKSAVGTEDTIATALAANKIVLAGGASTASLASYSFTATAGQTAFLTTGTSLSATPLVFLNGALQLISTTYTVSAKTVTFVEARLAGESVVIVG